MSELIDAAARTRFREEWRTNFAVSANAGSGKTTAISERLASMALATEASVVLPKTAVVTYTKKAAQQIGQRARTVLLKRLGERGARGGELAPLDHLERAFFGTIHSFCLLLARRYGQNLGINLNPKVINESDDEALWEEFLEEDAMQFSLLEAAQVDAFLRHVALGDIFELARNLDAASARRLLARRRRSELPAAPAEGTLARLLALPAKGSGKRNIELTQRAAAAWMEAWKTGRGFLPPFEPAGSAAAVCALATEWMAPLKTWLADAGAVLAAELAERYRIFRFERGVQTYADQIDAAMAVLRDGETLEKIRAEGWRVILDEAQDTDPQQFAVLVEIARPPGAVLGEWPGSGGVGPRAGHFCMVGDGQQSIYGSRADIRNFVRHKEAFGRRDGGELLEFHVTFRAPHRVIELLNAGLPAVFGEEREYNLGLSVAEGAPPTMLQVKYEPLAAGPMNVDGRVSRLELSAPKEAISKVDAWMTEEARQIAAFLSAHGPAGVGAETWGEVCVLAPRNDWLATMRKVFEAAGLKVALQMRRNRNGDNPVYAWTTGLLAVVCDPDNTFEWVGMLREIFAVSDAAIAEELKTKGAIRWDEPGEHAEPLRGALATVRPWVLRANDEGVTLEGFSRGLAEACGLKAKARLVDPNGALEGELERLLAEAATLGLEGAGPREWLRELLAGIDEGRPAGKSEEDAINLLTSHSAKGLEWPVVIVCGLWRRMDRPPERGLRLIAGAGQAGEPRVFFDGGAVPSETVEARRREYRRELVRLMYVTLTRPRRHLVFPWGEGFGAKARGNAVGFADLWGATERWMALPALGTPVEAVLPPKIERMASSANRAKGACQAAGRAVEAGASEQSGEAQMGISLSGNVHAEAGKEWAALPGRLLPHQLAEHVDVVRQTRHETSTESVLPARERDGGEAVQYGVWWHETMEFMPWAALDEEVVDYCDKAVQKAIAQGFESRAREELAMLRKSNEWGGLRDCRWVRQTELAVFAPYAEGVWIDGVVDFVLWSEERRELWIVDWKTNGFRNGESGQAVIARLREVYATQLEAYGCCLAYCFSKSSVRLSLYSTAAGCWTDF